MEKLTTLPSPWTILGPETRRIRIVEAERQIERLEIARGEAGTADIVQVDESLRIWRDELRELDQSDPAKREP